MLSSGFLIVNSEMKLHEIYLEVPSEQIAYVKFIFESYEDIGIIRTVDRKKAIIVLLAMEDFLASACAILASLENEIPLRQIARPSTVSDDWLMAELAVESTTR
ncbi:MAG TPA: DUF4911 domain-containing protein [Candidatus Eisenbacteria bacterium]|jgi:hypothetical protein|nr:DUF4911 domain-containing protein [Candidatus Eisenbacteria bacterium]